MIRKKRLLRLRLACNIAAVASVVIGSCYCLVRTDLYFVLGCFATALITGTSAYIVTKLLDISVDREIKESYVQTKEVLEEISGDLDGVINQIRRETQNASVQNDLIGTISNDMVQLAEQIKQTAAYAENANKEIDLTYKNIKASEKKVAELACAMQTIEKCYWEIKDYVGLIQNIVDNIKLFSVMAGKASKADVSKEKELVTDTFAMIVKCMEASIVAVSIGKELVTDISSITAGSMEDTVNLKQDMDNIVVSAENQQKKIANVTATGTAVIEIITASIEENFAISQQLSECIKKIHQTTDFLSHRKGYK